MTAVWNKLRSLLIFFKVVKNPERTELIFAAVDILSRNTQHAKIIAQMEQKLMSVPTFSDLYQRKYAPPAVTLQTLKSLPVDSFGQALYQHITNNHLDWELFPEVELHRPIDYLTQKIYQDRDLWHVLLGFNSQVEDELGLQAFGVAQYGSPLGCVIIAGGLLHLLSKDPKRAVRALAKVADGYRRGLATDFLLGQRLYEELPQRLDLVRQKFHIAPSAV